MFFEKALKRVFIKVNWIKSRNETSMVQRKQL